MDTSNSTQKRKLTDASMPWTTMFSMDKLLESSTQCPSSTITPRLISSSRILIRKYPNKNYSMPSSSTEIFSPLNWKHILMVLAEVMHTSNIRARKMQIRQWRLWTAKKSRARSSRLTSMRRRPQETIKPKPNSTTCLLRICQREPMITNLSHYSLSSETSSPPLFNAMSKAVLRTTATSALKIQTMLRLLWSRWIRNR